MSLTVRLRGLPPVANAIHIRNFFSGLKIQYGGVKIIGGVYGEAFVNFTTFKDACYALQRSGNFVINSRIAVSLEEQLQQPPPKSHHRFAEKPGYLRISLQPLNATFSDVQKFFKDLSVKSVIFLTKNKVRNGQALVKFVKRSHAYKALKSELSAENENGFSVTSVKASDEKEWIKFGGKIDPSARENSAKGMSYRKSRERQNYVTCNEFYAHLTNVSRSAEVRHIKSFLSDLVDDSHITFVYNKHGDRTRHCFVLFLTDDDYTKALGLDKAMLKGRPVRVLPVSKEQMRQFIAREERRNSKDTDSETSTSPSSSGAKATCVYLRNFAANVNKSEILNFFSGFALNEDDVHLLEDDTGARLGEALVKFSTEEGAENAEKLNRKIFRGTEILVRCISEEQLKAFGVMDFGFTTVDGHDSPMEREESWACVSMEDDTPDLTSDSP